jgi:hypothetical protein
MNDLARQINEAHTEVLKGLKGSLEWAIKAGEVLILAKENAKAEKKAWGAWLDENCPAIAPRTDRLYRQLAEHKAEIEEWQRVATFERMSLREAIAAIKDEDPPPKRKKKRKKKSTLEAMLADLAPDEVFKAVRDEWEVAEVSQLGNRRGKLTLTFRKSLAPADNAGQEPLPTRPGRSRGALADTPSC